MGLARDPSREQCVTATGDRITYFDLPPEIRGAGEPPLVQGMTGDQLAERNRILETLRQAGGNRTKAAAMLGTSRVSLWKKMSRYSIDV